jgi:hypothetical protein
MARSSIKVFLVAGLVLAAAADAQVLCKTGGGTLNTRAACKPREMQVDPAAVGFQGPAGPKGPKGDTGAAGNMGAPGVVPPDTIYRRSMSVNGNPNAQVCGIQTCDLPLDVLLDCEASALTSGQAPFEKIGRAAADPSVCEACVRTGASVTPGATVLTVTAVCSGSGASTTSTQTSSTTTTTVGGS